MRTLFANVCTVHCWPGSVRLHSPSLSNVSKSLHFLHVQSAIPHSPVKRYSAAASDTGKTCNPATDLTNWG